MHQGRAEGAATLPRVREPVAAPALCMLRLDVHEGVEGHSLGVDRVLWHADGLQRLVDGGIVCAAAQQQQLRALLDELMDLPRFAQSQEAVGLVAASKRRLRPAAIIARFAALPYLSVRPQVRTQQ